MGIANIFRRHPKSKSSNTTPAGQLTPGSTRILQNGHRLGDRLHAAALSTLAWQVASIGLILLCVVYAARDTYNSKQSKFIPYVVEVNPRGEVTYGGVANKANSVDDATIKATLANFIADARLVTPDVALQRKAIFRLYAHMKEGEPAATKMSAFLADPNKNPIKRAVRETVNTEMQYVIRQTKDTWQVDWYEKMYDRSGVVIGQQMKWRALVEVYVDQPSTTTTEQDLLLNPRLIYVRDWNWAIQPS